MTIGIAIFMLAAGSGVTAPLENGAIKALLAGNTFVYTGPTSGVVTYSANGAVSVNDEKYGRATGNWWVEKNRYCRTYPAWQSTKCRKVWATSDGGYKMQGGYSARPK